MLVSKIRLKKVTSISNFRGVSSKLNFYRGLEPMVQRQLEYQLLYAGKAKRILKTQKIYFIALIN